MDRGKSSISGKSKKVSSHHGSEFFVLGTKSGREDSKAKVISVDRKRESTSVISNAPKKTKLNPSLRISGEVTNCSNSQELWEQMATECEPIDLVETLYAALDQNDNETVLRLLCGVIKLITNLNSRTKLDTTLYLALFYIAKLHPTIFCNDIIMSAFVHVLKRETNTKTRQSVSSLIIATNILTVSFCEKQRWPEIFLRIYIEDAMNERFWVDNEMCLPFVENICAVFQTIAPHHNLLLTDVNTMGSTINQQNRDIVIIDDDCDNSGQGNDTYGSTLMPKTTDSLCVAQNRFVDAEKMVEKQVSEAIKDQLNRRQHQDCYTRNFVKFLCSTSGLSEVRTLCIPRLELWIHNGKLVKCAQQLLAYICFNVKSANPKDHEVLAILIKMRLKTKPLINFYMTCLKEMIILQPDALRIILKLVVQNELSNTRNPNNMGMLGTMFQTFPEESATYLAEIYRDYLLQREDCLRTLRVFMRELVKMLRYDINILKFCKIFLNEAYDQRIENSEFRDRIFHSMVDITCLCMLLTVSPQIREASASIRSTRDINLNPILLQFFNQMSHIQLEAVSWMYQVVPKIFKLQNADYKQALHKLLLLESFESYSRCDQWPSEPERATLLRLIAETPIHEESLMRIILIGITKNIPFTVMETIDTIMLVIKRASAMKVINYPAVETTKFDIIDFLFSMAEYHHPENIQLPLDYEPPKLAITILYWKVWVILLMISAHNPANFGAFCWDTYPTMKMLIEMCITNQFNENIVTKDELQIVAIEKEHILEFESYLASQTITEENAILISQLMLMDPMGPARKIPAFILEQLKFLNKSIKLGHLLCRSRKPDLLLDIIQRQGTTQSMPWLSDLVQNSEGDFNHLPVQCLCEFLLFNVNNINEENSRDAELVDFLRNLVMEPQVSNRTLCEVLDYVFRRLASTVKQSRIAALGGIKIIFKCSNSFDNDWLLRCIPQMPHFKEARPFIILQLRSACQVENCPNLVMSYIKFIAAHTHNDNVTDMLDHVFDMAQLIVERSTMFQHIIPQFDGTDRVCDGNDELHENRLQTLKCLFVMFNNYVIKLREHHEPYEWTEYPDLLMVQFEDGVQLPLHLNIIHAFIILLTHSTNNMPESIPILEYWFTPGRFTPIAYLPGLPHEPVQLLPDWLKLKMIRSSVDRLIEAAMHELTPDQIVLFVQNFGTPVNSMTKLLALFDHAVIEQFECVRNAILNKAYLAQLIEIQQLRGAKNGHFTVQALELHAELQSISDRPKLSNVIFEIINLNHFNRSILHKISSDEYEKHDKVIENILKKHTLTSTDEYHFRKFIYKIILDNDKKIRDDDSQEIQEIIALCIKYFDSVDILNHVDRTYYKYHFATLCRAISGCNIDKLRKRKILKSLIKHLTEASTSTIDRNSCYYNSLINILYPEKFERTKNEYKILLINELKNKDLIQISEYDLMINSHNDQNTNNILCKSGIIVDWLSVSDPELTTISNQLFSNKCGDFRHYLLSLMCHQANWNSLVCILSCLFKQSTTNTNSSISLNFIESLLNNPKLWQGRDKCVSKVEQTEEIFSLCMSELNTFAQFILNEGQIQLETCPKSYDYRLCSRINLLFRVIKKRSYDLVKFCEYVFQNSTSQVLKSKIFQQVYLMYPSIKFILVAQTEQLISLQHLKGCQADKVSNYLITCLGNLLTKKDFEALSVDTELLLRKLAASHPTLFLRQLGVLSSLIQGRSQCSMKILRDEYHYHRFTQILRILELLQDIIFDDTYKVEFQNILNCYFTFLKHHGYVKEFYHNLIKFVELLQLYMNTNPASACVFIEQHVGILMDLSSKFSNIASLHQLVQGIALIQCKSVPCLNETESKQDYDLEERLDKPQAVETDSMDAVLNLPTHQNDANNKVAFVISSGCAKTEVTPPHFLNLMKIIKESNSEGIILGPLQEIESLTSKRFSFLNELFDRLLELIFSSSAQVRSNAFILLIRLLKHNSGRSDVNRCALNAYIQCLRDENSSVAATAIDNLAEMTVLLQEYAIEILSVAFSLGIRSSLNTNTQIKRVTQTLLLQYGY